MTTDEYRMNPEVKELWLEALRSGRYEQGHGRLRNGKDQFCPLGVLCDLAVDAGISDAKWEQYPTRWDPNPPFNFRSVGGSSGHIPTPAIETWAGLFHDLDPIAGYGSVQLAKLNDKKKLSLLEIADIIEENL